MSEGPVPHSRPTLGEREREALLETLASGQVAQGPRVARVEGLVPGLVGGGEAVATGSGTQALLLALRASGIGEGHRVGLPAFTCSAVLYAVAWSGAEPVPLDNAPGWIAPDPATAAAAGPLDALIIVHPWGHVQDTAAFEGVAPLLIEDCAQSIGARSADLPVGGVGAAAVVSFYATKMLCAGEGGAVVLRDDEAARRARDLRDYDGAPTPARRFNLKMSDLHAALAEVQIDRLPEFLSARARIARRFDEALPELGLRPVQSADGTAPSWYRYLCWADQPVDDLLSATEAAGVHCRRPVPVTMDRLVGGDPLPGAALAFDHLVSIPIYPTLSEAEQQRVIEAVAAAVGKRVA